MDIRDTISERLRSLGFDQPKIDETIDIFYKNLQEELIGEFVTSATEEEITTYENRMKSAKSLEHLSTIVQEIAARVYGENADKEIQNRLMQSLEELEQMTKDIKETYDKYQAGDPETVKAVQDSMNTEAAQDIAQQLSS